MLNIFVLLILRPAGDEGQGRPPSAGEASGAPVPVSAVGGELSAEEDQLPDQLEASLREQCGGISGRSAAALGGPR